MIQFRKSMISRNRLFQICLVIMSGTILFAGCNSDKISPRASDSGAAATKANVTKNVKPVADAEVAVIETENPAYGPVVIELYYNVAPKMVEQFKRLINERFYDGTTFHRVNAEAGLIQGGDPLSKDNDPANDGTGNSSYSNVKAEFSDIPYEGGTVGAARQGAGLGLTVVQAWDTANCQFFITLQRQTAFDQEYTVFGRVISDLSKADIISHAPVAARTERPVVPVVIKHITLQPRTNFAQ